MKQLLRNTALWARSRISVGSYKVWIGACSSATKSLQKPEFWYTDAKGWFGVHGSMVTFSEVGATAL